MENTESTAISNNTNNIEQHEQREQQNECFYRRIQIVAGGRTVSVSLPRKYADELKLKKNESVRISKDDGRILIEKVD